MIKLLLALSIIAIPFSDFYPLLPLGELKSELSAYLFLITIGLLSVSYFKPNPVVTENHALPSVAISQPFAKMAVVMFAVVGISFFANLQAMLGPMYHGRFPMEKFLTSSAMFAYGFTIAYATYILSKQYAWHDMIMKPVAISLVICAVITVFEMLAWTGGGFQKLYVQITKIIHLGFDFTGGNAGWTMEEWLVPGRARSVSFEPPFLANFAGFAWPWAYAGIFTAPQKHKPFYKVMWLLCTLLIIAANSRTGYVLLAGNLLTLLLLRTIYLSQRPRGHLVRRAVSFLLIMLTVGGVMAFFMNLDAIITHVVTGDSVSNITRFASIVGAFKMFVDTPIWGYGFGQYGFHAVNYLPSWGFYSYELIDWLTKSLSIWPPVFSIYARFAAELGILGVGAWVGMWVTLAQTVWRVTYAYQLKTGQVLAMSYPLIMGCSCALLFGIQMDSLRTPMMWITMGLACSYIYDVRSRLQNMTSPTATGAVVALTPPLEG